ncbi:MAG: DUF4260 domain-containing protein [Opitutaceae bacterium]|nr:DUF4260 domain-containing protein [Opitutaceae bacterium]
MNRARPSTPAMHPTFLLRLEAAVALALALLVYRHGGASWWWFAAGLLAPDLSMLGYLGGNTVGAWCYNLAHTYTLPFSLAAVAWLTGSSGLVPLAAVWCSHIALDRTLGYGLKLTTGFHHTHLGAIGRQARDRR